jgi:2-oxoisovalerate dehydrogenase E2 component (dihydrolipoyl transacylase)
VPEYKLPDVGEGLTEAEIVTWKVKVGDVIEINDIVVEIETAKSLVELPSPFAGTVLALLVPEGETVAVGTPIISIGDPSEATSSPSAGPGDADLSEMDLSNPAASGGGEGESLVGRMKAERGATRRARRKPGVEIGGAATAHAGVQDAFNPAVAHQHDQVEQLVETLLDDSATQATAVGAPVSSGAPVPATPAPVLIPHEARVLAKPPVRKLAKELGVDLATCAATGPSGSISRADVEAAASGSAVVASPAVPVSEGAGETREPVKGVRKMMAQAMVSSAFSAPHVTEWITVDVTATMEFVDRLKKRREFRDLKVSPLLILSRAVMLAMRRTRDINSFWDEAAQEVVFKSYVNLGIAAATPRGLVVPNIKSAEQLSLADLADALADLTATARDGKTQPAEMSGGTFTITNVGVFGVDAGTPIINPGESAILCFGAVRKQPWVVTGADGSDELGIRQITTLALSFDHRHIDGEKGSRFLADVAGILEDPASALLF